MPVEHDCKPGVSFSPQREPRMTRKQQGEGPARHSSSLGPQGLCQHRLLLGAVLTMLSGLLLNVAVSNVHPWVLDAREGECFMTSEINAVGEVCIFFVCHACC